MNLYRIFTFLLLIFFVSCQKATDEVPLSSEKEFVSFRLEKHLNTSLDATVKGKITDYEIRLKIPELADKKKLIATFEYHGKAVFVNSIEQESEISVNDFSSPFNYLIVAEDGTEKVYSVVVQWIDELRSALPHIFIDIDNNENITSKTDYVNGNLRIDGKDKYVDFEGRMKIRGRGNTSWYYRKKPYKIKLDSKASLLGMHEYKEWVLLAEYLDGSMLYNSIPFKTGRLLEMPFTNHMIPVELTINGKYQGVYSFTEHKEVGEYRIDLGDNGLLLELDNYFDETWKFKSEKYKLPVMVQFPKEKDMSDEKLNEIKTEFERFESLVFDSSFPDNDYLSYFDDISFINYMIVYQLTHNQEINHPRSTYIHQLAGGKYRMGIIWDFDWGFGYEINYNHYDISTAPSPLFWEKSTPGKVFFSRIMEDPHMQIIFKERWNWFRTNKYQELKDYVISWSEIIKDASVRDHALWGLRGSTGNSNTDLERTLNWLDARVVYIDGWLGD